MNKRKDTLKTRDIAAIGIFSALLFVIAVAVSGITGLVPAVYMYAPAIMAFISGPVFMLIIAKVHKTGAVLLPCLIVGLIFLVMGSPLALICLIIAGILGEAVVSKSKYQNLFCISLAHVFYTAGYYMGTIGPIYYMTAMYTRQGNEMFDEAYIEALLTTAHTAGAYLAIPAMIAAGFLGSVFGRKLMKKHFDRAGII